MKNSWFQRIRKSALLFDKELFDQAMDAFCTEMGRLGRIRSSDLSKTRSKRAAEMAAKHYLNDFAARSVVYPEFAQKIGNDFMDCVKTIVAPCVPKFLDVHSILLLKHLNMIFEGGLTNAIQAERSYAVSIGKEKNEKAYVLPLQSIFNGEASRTDQEFQSFVKQHNLRAIRDISAERKKGVVGII